MIDSTLRTELSQDIRRLATGRMTNDEFDDRYDEVYLSSDDDAITSIATYCYCLYSSDLLLPMRLRGRYALDRETKRTIARCVLFLRSGNEYAWPRLPDDPVGRFFAGFAFSLGFPGGIALTLVGLLMAIFDPGTLAFLMLATGLPLAGFCLWFGLFRPSVPPHEWRRYTNSGDYECWPFLKRDAFQLACKRNHLLGQNVLR